MYSQPIISPVQNYQQQMMLQQLAGLNATSLMNIREFYYLNPFSNPRLLPLHEDPHINVSIHKSDIWDQFKGVMTEMIVTKQGRRMFPTVELTVTGLEKNATYSVLMEILPLDGNKYRHNGKTWVVAGKAELHIPKIVTHSDSPAAGYHWMNNPISFSKVKLTNNNMDNNGNIILNSMHKYRIYIHFVTQRPYARDFVRVGTFEMKAMDFIAVTAYQFDHITDLKIKLNPFAKGFRNKPRKKTKGVAKPGTEDKREHEDDNNEDFDIDVVNPFTPAPIENQDPYPIQPIHSVSNSDSPVPAFTTLPSHTQVKESDPVVPSSSETPMLLSEPSYSSSIQSSVINSISPSTPVPVSSCNQTTLHPFTQPSNNLHLLNHLSNQHSDPFSLTKLPQPIKTEPFATNPAMKSLYQYYLHGDKTSTNFGDHSIRNLLNSTSERQRSQSLSFHPYRTGLNPHAHYYSHPQYVHH